MCVCVYVCVCVYIYIYIYIQLFFFSIPGITLNQHLVAWVAHQNLCQMTCIPLEVRQVWKWWNFHVGSISHQIIANDTHGEMTSLYQQFCFNGYCVRVRHKELWKRKGSYSLGSPLYGGEDQPGPRGSFRALEESSETGHGRQNWEQPAEKVSIAALCFPGWDAHLSVKVRAGCWSSGFRKRTGDGWGETAWRGWTVATEGVPLKKTRPAIEAKCHYWRT